MANSVMLEEVSKGLYILGQNSSLISNITFGYSIHSLMVESEIYENNEWYDFAFGINLKILDSYEDVITLTDHELNLISKWLDWVCRTIIESDGEHHSNKFIRTFLSDCSSFFAYVKKENLDESIIIEKSRKVRK